MQIRISNANLHEFAVTRVPGHLSRQELQLATLKSKTMLGAERNLVRLVPHQPLWQQCFREESERLSAALGDQVVQIEHVGSTSVPGLEAKPILDIVVAVRDLAGSASFEQPLRELGYVHKMENDMPGRLYFVKRTAEGLSTHHLNVTEPGTECWVTHVGFRDYLRAHPKARQEYQELKRDLARRHQKDRPAYTEGKSAFIQRVLALAASGKEDG